MHPQLKEKLSRLITINVMEPVRNTYHWLVTKKNDTENMLELS